MRYVRFWRGSADDFARITHKNEDTMYFVIQPDTNSFTMYLGATELLSGDDLNSSSIDALEDVIISKKLYDRQVLMYDALQECWVNASLDKAAGAYVGPTAEYMGLPGMLPGAPAGSENLFFRSDGKWVEQHIEKVENIDKLQHVELIANITAQWSEVNKNDLIIIEDILSNNLKNDIAYWYDGKEWLSVSHSSIPSDYAESDPQAPSYILNRPFYDLRKQESLDVTFDGNLEGKDVVSGEPIFNLDFVKLTDITPTVEELLAGTLTARVYGEYQDETTEATISELTVEDLRAVGLPLVAFIKEDLPFFIVAYEDGTVEGITFTKGTYGAYTKILDATVYVSRLYVPSILSGEIKKLDNKFIDAEWMATVQRKEMVLLSETRVEAGREYALENKMPTYPINVKVLYDDTLYICKVGEFYDMCQYFGNLAGVGAGADTGEPFFCVVVGNIIGVCLRDEVVGGVEMSVSIVYNDYEKLPLEFLPDDIGATPLMVRWDKNDLSSVYLALRDGWQAGRTVIVYDVANIDQLRLLFFDGDDPDIWYASFVDFSGALYYLYCNGGWAHGSADGFAKVISFGYSEYQEPETKMGQVLVGKDDGFGPALLNSTLTEGSTLPAQEGAVFTAIQEIKNLITPINEALEAALEGGN